MRLFSVVPFAAVVACALAIFFAPRASASPVYFVVSELPGQEAHHDSYILPLTNPSDIAHARDLIAQGTSAGATIAVAKIAAGADGINRNITAPNEPLWNWHVTSFEGFADTAVEVLDGWSAFVEQDIPGWLANTNSTIGFWSYTVTRELAPAVAVPLPAPVAGGLMLLAVAAIALRRWQGLAHPHPLMQQFGSG